MRPICLSVFTLPRYAFKTLLITISAVVFPVPFPPSIQKVSPSFTLKLNPLNTSGLVLLYLNQIFLHSNTLSSPKALGFSISSSSNHSLTSSDNVPSLIATILSAKYPTFFTSCSAIIIVVPKSLLILPIKWSKVSFAIGSSIAIGSSKIKTSGSATIVDARFKICFCPPDNSSTFLKYQSVIPKYSEISATRSFISSVGTPSFSKAKANSL